MPLKPMLKVFLFLSIPSSLSEGHYLSQLKKQRQL